MLFLITLGAIISLVLAMTWLKLPPFVAFTGVSILAGVAFQLSPEIIFKAIQEGMGSTLGSIAGILAFGSILGKWVGISGAAQKMTEVLLKLSGTRYARIAFMLAGFLVGLPLFYSVAFMLLAPLVISAAAKLKQPATFLALPMLASLTVTQGYLPPHPAPLAIMQEFGADLSKTMLYGVAIAIPAILVSGLWFGMTTINITTPANQAFVFVDNENRTTGPQLSTFASFLMVLFPIILLALGSFGSNTFPSIAAYISNPVFSLFLSVLLAGILLKRIGFSSDTLLSTSMVSIKDIAGILLIFGGAGALKQVLVVAGVSQAVADSLGSSTWNVYVLGWTMAAIIRVCVGSSTVAGITAAGFMKVILVNSTADPNLMVLALGAGSMMFSHVNDTGFWLFREYFSLNFKDTIRSWTLMDTLVSITGLIGVLVLDQILF
ncbi:gluconate transporter [Aquirufa ecclesiirivi]|uniref:GntP family permease n=1 Tax=Aquirufa ecclesiirivi TaxID=2715124 RepID=UPI0022A84B93|nr:gluconate:H+ symporter [Aquirufa ecclesiirivi]MCZ2472868.1 gluconate transporter [Aquirufa ecclesiirivi]